MFLKARQMPMDFPLAEAVKAVAQVFDQVGGQELKVVCQPMGLTLHWEVGPAITLTLTWSRGGILEATYMGSQVGHFEGTVAGSTKKALEQLCFGKTKRGETLTLAGGDWQFFQKVLEELNKLKTA